MRVSMDNAGRVVIPKSVRDQLGFTPGRALDAEVVSGRLELSTPDAPATLVQGPHGPSFAGGTPITDEDVRHVLESVRERR